MKIFRFYTPHDYENQQKVRVAVVGQFNDGILRLSASRCSKKDAFSKLKGRKIAEGRLQAGRILEEVPYDGEQSEVKFFVKHASIVEKNVVKDMGLIHSLYEVD